LDSNYKYSGYLEPGLMSGIFTAGIWEWCTITKGATCVLWFCSDYIQHRL